MVRSARRGLAVGVVVGLGALGAPALGAGPAGAATPAITVTPSTGLLSGSTVTVTGTGYPPGDTGVVQCATGVASAADCDLSQVGYALAAADGSFSAVFTVRRTIRVDAGTVRCADSPDACVIAAGNLADMTIGATHPIAFDPNAPAPAPVLSVSPDTDLVTGQTVTVAGSGFRTGSVLVLSQCAASCTDSIADVTTDATGAFTTTFVVRNRVPLANGTANCLEGGCMLAATDYANTDYNASASLTFDPNGPAPLIPAIAATPDEDLEDRQTVVVTGTGFDPQAFLLVSQCAVAAAGGCFVRIPAFVSADPDGAFSLELRVHRLIPSGGFPGSDPVDCALEVCEIHVSQGDGSGLEASALLAFDPVVPPSPPPVVTAAPTTDLGYREPVTVTGRGFSPGVEVTASMCGQASDFGFCSSSGFGTADETGSVTLTVIARRIVNLGFEAEIDCAAAPGTCEVQVDSDDLLASAVFPLTFDPDAPPPPPPTVTVEPATDLPFRAPVTARADGFAPGDQVLISQCRLGADQFTGPCAGGQVVTADASGHVEATFTVRRTLSNGFDPPLDCATAPGVCSIVATAAIVGGGEQAEAPLAFDPDAPVPPPPTVAVAPASGLDGGATVDVSGAGFTPNASLGFTVCAAGTLSLNRCDIGRAVFTNADADGAFTGQLQVPSTITTSEGAIDCAASPGACEVGAANLSDFTENGRAALSFGPEIAVGDAGSDRSLVTVPVSLSRPSTREVRVHWATADDSARAGEDYVAGAGDLVFAPGETEKTVTIELLNGNRDRDARFFIDLSSPAGGSVAADAARTEVVVAGRRDHDDHGHRGHHHHGHHHHGHDRDDHDRDRDDRDGHHDRHRGHDRDRDRCHRF